tara:strand:+ start:24173 stop:25171 length:999 start_codon:yes stop_codon:yes gene_type:complete
MTQAPRSSGLRRLNRAAILGLLTPATALVAAAWFGNVVVGEPEDNAPLLAQGTTPPTANTLIDSDGDAIPDAQEFMLGTAVLNADNDQDGWEDSIEIAHGTSPFDMLDTPAATASVQAGIGLTARSDGTNIRICVVMHAPDGSMAGKTVRFGLLTGGVLHGIPIHRLGLTRETFTADFGAEGSVEVWDLAFPAAIVVAQGSATFVAALGSDGLSNYTTAETLDLSSRDGTVLMRRKKSLTPGQGHSTFTLFGDSDTVHQPIPTAMSPVPVEWPAGRVCFQRAVTVGIAGARIVREVVEAECHGNWDSYCDPNCEGTVGLLIESIDPGLLVGG